MTTLRQLQRAMDHAASYEEWKTAALAYDRKAGHDRWKLAEQSRRYDWASIRQRLECLRGLREAGDNRGLLYCLHEGIHGNIGGMGRPALYDRARFGTKQLIVDYVDEVVSALRHLADPRVDEIGFAEKLDFFRRADHCFGHSAFMMSGSGSLFYFHIGVVRALLEQDLLPNVLSGSSGGAFVGSLLSTHSRAELDDLLDPERLIDRMEHETGHLRRASRLRPRVMRIEEIRVIVESLVPDLTFDEALRLKSRLLNAITTPNVYLREAVLASAAVPGVYPAVALAAKNHLGEKQPYLPARRWVDGSVSDDMPAKRLARLYGVNHYIVSQTNPHVIPFVTDAKRRTDPFSLVRNASVSTARAWVNAGAASLERPLSLSPSLNRFTNIALSVLNQDYIGDINILPPNRFFNPFKVLAYLSAKEILELVDQGQRATWPRIEMIRIQTRISRCLAQILRDYDDEHVRHVKAALRRRAS